MVSVIAYLPGRRQYVHSWVCQMTCGVPQGSVLGVGLILFIMSSFHSSCLHICTPMTLEFNTHHTRDTTPVHHTSWSSRLTSHWTCSRRHHQPPHQRVAVSQAAVPASSVQSVLDLEVTLVFISTVTSMWLHVL